MVFGSYRDLNLQDTVAVYDEAAGFLESFTVSDREMTKYIIGTISDLDSPLTVSMKGTRAVENYLQHITQQDLEQERQQILDLTQQQVRQLAPLVAACMKQNYVCVLAGEDKIQQSKDLFTNLILHPTLLLHIY